MKRAATMLVWVAGMYVVLMLGSGLLIKALLTGGRIDAVVHSLNARMPVAVSVAEGSFDLMQWFRFQRGSALPLQARPVRAKRRSA